MSWTERLALQVYGAVMSLLSPLLRLKLWRRARREPGYALHVAQRFGHYDAPAPAAGGIWIHAVSLGEARAAALLLPALRDRWPGIPLLLTHGTATGWAQGSALLQPGDQQAWLPWDSPQATRRFLAHFRPRLGLLMETEVWPSLVQACAGAGVPLVLANARLSAKSLRQAQRLAALAAPAYRGLTAALAQTEADAERLARIGAPVAGVFGNVKFDVASDGAQTQRAAAWRAALGPRPVVMLASTREGEEALWLDAMRQARSDPSLAALREVLWLVVPRHPQRFDEVDRLLRDAGWTVRRRSTFGEAPPPLPQPGELWLGDSLGEMQAYYGLADLALLGASFAPLGGQNLIEALACECPVVMGPHTFNFAQVAQQAVQAGAAFEVRDLAQALACVNRLLSAGEGGLRQAAAAGLTLVAAGRGAAARQADALASLLPVSAPPANSPTAGPRA